MNKELGSVKMRSFGKESNRNEAYHSQNYKLKEEFSRIDPAKERICDPKKQASKRDTSQGEKRQKLPEKIWMDHGTDEQNEDIIWAVSVLNGENRNKEIFEEVIAENFLELLKNI